ncbi:MAG: glycosyltransferase family 4 protein [Marmoricola sp.]
MKVLVHDYAGHPFQAQLSRSLAGRGHDVVHSYCAAYASGKGRLEALPGEALRFEPIGADFRIAKMDFGRRLIQEVKLGFELVGLIRRERPDVVMVANVPIPTLSVMALALIVLRIPWVLWHQDVQAVAIRSFAGEKLGRGFKLVADGIEIAERWCARRAKAIVVISDGFLGVHRDWGTASKTTVIPNWAPLDEIVPVERDNAWSAEHQLSDGPRIVYSGTLGLKHNPTLLPQLAARVRDLGIDAQLVIVNEGPAEDLLRDEARRLDVDLVLLPFQPYERLSEVLGSADVLVVLLEKDAGVFSVPSKTLSYLCAGRPVLGMMPSENLAAALVSQIDGCVVSPDVSSLDEAAAFVVDVITDAERAATIGKAARELAEREFGLGPITDRFELILSDASR